MAKKKTATGLEQLEQLEDAEATTNGKPEPKPPAVKRTVNKRTTTKRVQLPTQEPNEGAYLPSHVELRLRDRNQALTLKRITLGLQAQHATLRSGRHVDNYADALRYILEQLEP